LSLRQYFFGLGKYPGANVERTSETFANVEGQTLKLDVYLSRIGQEKLSPAIIVVHGGSWSAGERGDYPQWNEWLARQGFAVFDIDYRLAPQPNWRTATGDVKCAIAWVKANASRYEVDAARIALLGRSAGGHLALLAAYSTNDVALAPSCASTADLSVRAVVALYAPTNLNWGFEHPANKRVLDGTEKIRNFIGGSPASATEAFRLASATSHVNAQTPPTLLFHGGRDQLVRDENMSLLVERLTQQNVPHRAVLIPYAQHGFDYNFNGWGSQIARQIISEFLQTHVENRL
jgi:acetyl esterase/lipase